MEPLVLSPMKHNQANQDLIHKQIEVCLSQEHSLNLSVWNFLNSSSEVTA